MALVERRNFLTALLALTVGSLAISGEALRDMSRWGDYDWDYFFSRVSVLIGV